MDATTEISSRRIDELLNHYAQSHLHPTNERIHFAAIPLIMLSLIGLMFCLHPLVASRPGLRRHHRAALPRGGSRRAPVRRGRRRRHLARGIRQRCAAADAGANGFGSLCSCRGAAEATTNGHRENSTS